uniref:Avirulence protein n=1 Tax=Hyaloperonospora parasitica TaxID=123356 RepID=Q4VKJ1_9STRA|nr:avirulence protein [Hyaloperonospora parasitica]
MRVCYFVLLPSVALAVIATESSETSRTIVHVFPLRDVADHRNDALINRALRAQAALDDDEERWPFGPSAVKALIRTIDSHRAGLNDEAKMKEVVQTWNKLIERDNLIDEIGKHYSKAPGPVYDSYDEALATMLVTTYSYRGVARAILHPRPSDPISNKAGRAHRLEEAVASLWKERGYTSHNVVSNIATDDDVDFFASTAFTFLVKCVESEDDANNAIFEYFGSNPSRYFSAVLHAMEKPGADIRKLENSKKWMFRLYAQAPEPFSPPDFEWALARFQDEDHAFVGAQNDYKKLSPSQIEKLVEEYSGIYSVTSRNFVGRASE